MKTILFIVLVICLAKCKFQEFEDRAEFLLTRYASGFNNGNWGEYASTITKDMKIGGANGPLFIGRDNYVDGTAAVYATN